MALVSTAARGGGSSGSSGFTTVTKLADQSVTSNVTVANDSELFFTAGSGAAYEIEISVIYVTPTAVGQDIKYDFGEDGTLRGIGLLQIITTAGAQFSGTYGMNQSAGSAGGVASVRVIYLRGWYIGGGGTFRFRWAQNASSVNPTTVKANSVIRYRQLN